MADDPKDQQQSPQVTWSPPGNWQDPTSQGNDFWTNLGQMMGTNIQPQNAAQAQSIAAAGWTAHPTAGGGGVGGIGGGGGGMAGAPGAGGGPMTLEQLVQMLQQRQGGAAGVAGAAGAVPGVAVPGLLGRV
jgi:hypothetical protein